MVSKSPVCVVPIHFSAPSVWLLRPVMNGRVSKCKVFNEVSRWGSFEMASAIGVRPVLMLSSSSWLQSMTSSHLSRFVFGLPPSSAHCLLSSEFFLSTQ